MSDTKTEKTVAEELREAAAGLRANPKRPVDEPLASWLETTAARFDDEVDGHLHDTCDGAVGQDCYCFREALAVARVLNGTAS